MTLDLYTKNEDDDLVSKICRLGDTTVPPPSVETECSPHSFIIYERKRSDATSILRSFDMSNERIALSFGSIAT